MRTLLISYDLRGREDPGEYERLIAAIRRYPCCEVMYSLWLLRTERSVETILDELWAQMDSNDRLFVTDVTGDVMGWLGLSPDIGRWIMLNNPAG